MLKAASDEHKEVLADAGEVKTAFVPPRSGQVQTLHGRITDEQAGYGRLEGQWYVTWGRRIERHCGSSASAGWCAASLRSCLGRGQSAGAGTWSSARRSRGSCPAMNLFALGAGLDCSAPPGAEQLRSPSSRSDRPPDGLHGIRPPCRLGLRRAVAHRLELRRGLKAAGKKLKAFGEAITGMGTKTGGCGRCRDGALRRLCQGLRLRRQELANMSQRTGISVEALSELALRRPAVRHRDGDAGGGHRRMQKDDRRRRPSAQQVRARSPGKLGLTVGRPARPLARSAVQAHCRSPVRRSPEPGRTRGAGHAALRPLRHAAICPYARRRQGSKPLPGEARKLGLTMSSAEDARRPRELPRRRSGDALEGLKKRRAS